MIKALQDWATCDRCGLHKYAMRHVLGKGQLPCDILIIGEAPGISEDAIGEPFVGPAGQLLDKAIPEEPAHSIYITNIVACRPTDGFGKPNRLPSEEEIKKCMPRVALTFAYSQAVAVVILGRTAQHVFDSYNMYAAFKSENILRAPHPAAILRSGGEKAPNWQRYKDTFSNFWKGLKC